MDTDKLIAIRDITVDECPWLEKPINKGAEMTLYMGATYGCVSPSGIACSIDGGPPFFELPISALWRASRLIEIETRNES